MVEEEEEVEVKESVTTAVSLTVAALSDTVEPQVPVFLKHSGDLALEHHQSVRTVTR